MHRRRHRSHGPLPGGARSLRRDGPLALARGQGARRAAAPGRSCRGGTGFFAERDTGFARTYFGALFPGYRVDQATIEQSDALLVEIGDDAPLLRRSLREANDDLQRAIRCRRFAAS